MGPIANAFVAGFNALILSGQPVPPHGVHQPRAAHHAPATAPLPRAKPDVMADAAAGGVPEAIGGAPALAESPPPAEADTAIAAAPAEPETVVAMADTGTAEELAAMAPIPVPRPAAGDAIVRPADAAPTAAGEAVEASAAPAGTAVAAASDGAAGALVEPIPRPRPDVPERQGAAPAASQIASIGPAATPPEALTAEGGPRYALVADAACLRALDRLSVVRETLPAITDGACGMGTPLKVRGIGDATALTPTAILDCGTAVALAEWVDQVVEPAATADLGGPVTGLRIADSYSCRSRDHIAGAKLSEHAFGNAVDVGAFQVGGTWLQVAAIGDEATPEARFLTTVRNGACDHFTTVLGPGQAYHDDHLHLDLAQHGKHGGRICK